MFMDFREKGNKWEVEKRQPVASHMHPKQESGPQTFCAWDDTRTNWSAGQGVVAFWNMA